MTSTLRTLLPALGLLAGLAASPTLQAAEAAPNASQTAADALSEGEVRKVDAALGKLTLRHGELRNLEMPPMTMVFRVKDAQLLQGLKAGDKIRFRAEKLAEGLTVTEIVPVR